MASAPTDWGSSYLLGVLFGLNVPPPGFWVALTTGEPGADTDGDLITDGEPDDPAYTRIFVPVGGTYWTLDGSFLTNVGAVNFPLPNIDWGTLDHYALCTASSSGEVYGYGELANPQDVLADSPVAIPQGGIVLALVNVDAPIAL